LSSSAQQEFTIQELVWLSHNLMNHLQIHKRKITYPVLNKTNQMLTGHFDITEQGEEIFITKEIT